MNQGKLLPLVKDAIRPNSLIIKVQMELLVLLMVPKQQSNYNTLQIEVLSFKPIMA